MSNKDFEIGKELGKGAFGSVAIVKRKADGKMYAMKRVKISQLGTKERENALNEVRILASLSHPNIIGYKEAFFEENTQTLNIVMEYADEGDLESKIQKNVKSRGMFLEKDIWSYLFQIVNGLKYLHDNKIMHRDLKCANIFMLKNGTIKLGDLNVSKIVKMGLAHTQTGTPYYASPEVWADKPYDYKSDIWSIGCVIYELCALKPPFRGQSLEQLFKNVTRGIYEQIPSTFSKDLANVIGLMLQTNPNNRPSCEQILSNEIVIKRMNAIREGKEIIPEQQPIQMLNTIKLPRNMNEINQRLPKKKKYQEIEEADLMSSDFNINKKAIANINPVVVDLSKKEGEVNKEVVLNKINQPVIATDNNNRQNLKVPINYQNNMNPKVNNNINYHLNPNINVLNPVNEINKKDNHIYMNQKVNNNINSRPNPNSNILNPVNEIIKKDNNININRPISSKIEVKQQPKTPVLLKENALLQQPNIQIKASNEPNSNLNQHPNLKNIVNKQVYNSNGNNGNNPKLQVINISSDNRNKPIPISSRPQSGKPVNNIISNDYNNKIQQINQIARKNIISDRPKSPSRHVNYSPSPYNKRPISGNGNSPINKSPIIDNRININNPHLRPSSEKNRVNINQIHLNQQQNNRQIILKNERKVVIEKVNFDRNMLNKPVKILQVPKQINYQVIEKNNLVGKMNDKAIFNNGPKIVQINNRK